MEPSELNGRCVELFYSPRVRNQMWNPRMFWNIGRIMNPSTDALTQPKVDLCELEVMLSAAAYVDSKCASDLEARRPGRAAFIRRAVQSGQRPMLHHG